MVAPFDIFRVDEPGGMLWIEAVAELGGAKARVAALVQTAPCKYLIFSQRQATRFQSSHQWLMVIYCR